MQLHLHKPDLSLYYFYCSGKNVLNCKFHKWKPGKPDSLYAAAITAAITIKIWSYNWPNYGFGDLNNIITFRTNKTLESSTSLIYFSSDLSRISNEIQNKNYERSHKPTPPNSYSYRPRFNWPKTGTDHPKGNRLVENMIEWVFWMLRDRTKNFYNKVYCRCFFLLENFDKRMCAVVRFLFILDLMCFIFHSICPKRDYGIIQL